MIRAGNTPSFRAIERFAVEDKNLLPLPGQPGKVQSNRLRREIGEQGGDAAGRRSGSDDRDLAVIAGFHGNRPQAGKPGKRPDDMEQRPLSALCHRLAASGEQVRRDRQNALSTSCSSPAGATRAA